jgi:hypothetical protein
MDALNAYGIIIETFTESIKIRGDGIPTLFHKISVEIIRARRFLQWQIFKNTINFLF